MNLEELQIKVSIELKDLEKQLKSITKSIDKTLGPQTTKRLMQSTHRVIKNESLAINKTLNKAFEVDYKSFNNNLNAAMNQAKLTVRSACNDIRRELNSALNVKANIRVTGKTSLNGSVAGSSGSTTTASSMASSQYIGAMIIKATNAIIKVNNANTTKLEQAINNLAKKLGSTTKETKPVTKTGSNNTQVNVPEITVKPEIKEVIVKPEVKVNVPDVTVNVTANKKEEKTGTDFILKEAGKQISLITKEMKDAVKVINILKRSFGNLSNSLNTKMLGTGSYGNNLPQTEHVNFTLGKEGELFIGTIERMKQAFKELKLLTTSGINFDLGDTKEQLINILELMKEIRSLRKALTFDNSKGFTMGDSTYEYHTGKVVNQKKSGSTKALETEEPLEVSFKVIDEEIKAQVNEAISKIKQVKLPINDVFDFDTGEIIAKVRETNEHIKQAFKDVQNIRKQANIPLLGTPTKETIKKPSTGSLETKTQKEIENELSNKVQTIKQAASKAFDFIKKSLKGLQDKLSSAFNSVEEIAPEIAPKVAPKVEIDPEYEKYEKKYGKKYAEKHAKQQAKREKKEEKKKRKQEARLEKLKNFQPTPKKEKSKKVIVDKEAHERMEAMKEAWRNVFNPPDSSDIDKLKDITPEEFKKQTDALKKAWGEASDPDKIEKDLKNLFSSIRFTAALVDPINAFLADVGLVISKELLSSINYPEFENMQKIKDRMNNQLNGVSEPIKPKPLDTNITKEQEKFNELTKQIKGRMADLTNVSSNLNTPGSYVTAKGNKLIGRTGKLQSGLHMEDAESKLKKIQEQIKQISDEFDTAISEISSLDVRVLEEGLSSLKDWVPTLQEAFNKLNQIDDERLKINLDTTEAQQNIETLKASLDMLIEACETNNLNAVRNLFGNDESISQSERKYPPKPSRPKSLKDTKEPKGKPPKPTIMGFGFGAYKNELEMLANFAKKAASKIKKALSSAFNSIKTGKLHTNVSNALNKAKSAVSKFGSKVRPALNKAFTGIKASKIYNNIAPALNKAKSAVSKFAAKVGPTLNKAFSKINVKGIANGISKGLNGAKKVLSGFANASKSLWGKIKSIFSKGASDASKATGKLKTGLGNLLKQALGFFSLYSLINLGKQAIQQSQDLAQSEVKLASLMKQRMGATNETVTAIRQLAEEQAKLGVVSETAMKNGAQQLARYVHSAKALKTLMPAIANLTAARGGLMATPEDAEEIATQLGEAIREGTTTPLEQSGIYLSEAEIEKFKALTTEEARAAYLADVIAKNVGNINEALANTPHGAIVQLKNNFKSLLGTLGIFLANVIKPIVQWLNVIVVACNNALKALGKLLGFDMTGGATTVPDIDTGGGGSTPVDTTTPDIDTGGIDDAKDAYDDAKDAADEATEANEKFKGSLMGFDELNILTDNTQKDYKSDPEKDPEKDPTDITPGEGGQLLPEVGELTEGDNIFDKFSDKMKAFIDEVLEPFKNAWDLLGDRWKAAWADLVDSFKNFCDSLARFLKSVWENGGKEFVQHMAEIALAVGIAAMEIGGTILDALAKLWDHLDPEKNMHTQRLLDVLNEVSVKLRDFILGLNEHLENLLEYGGQDVLNAMGDCFMDLAAAAVNTFGVIIDAVDGLIDHLDPKFNVDTRNMLQATADMFHAVGTAAWDFSELLKSALANGGQDVINAFGTCVVNLGETVARVITTMMESFSKFFDYIDPKNNEITRAMMKAWEDAFYAIGDAALQLATLFESIMDNGGQELLNAIGDLGMQILETFGNIVEEVADCIGNLFKHLDPAENKTAKNAIDSFKRFIDSIREFVRMFGDALDTFMESGGQEFVNNLGDIIALIVDLATTIAGGVIDNITAFFDSWAGHLVLEAVAKSLEIISGALEWLLKAIKPLTPIISDLLTVFLGYKALTGIASAITSVVTALGKLKGISTIVEWVGKLFTAFKNLGGASGILTLVKGGFTTLWGVISAHPIAAIITAIAAIGVALYNTNDDFKKFIDNILGGFKGVFDKIKEYGGKLLENIKEIFGSVIDIITGIFEGDGQKVGEAVRNLIINILELIYNLNQSFVEIGWELIKGLVKGIWECIKNLPSLLAGFCEFVVDFFKGLFGIHSPSTVFAELGVNLIEGLIEGITSMFDAIGETISNLVDSILEAFNTITDKLSEIWNNVKDNATEIWTTVKDTIVDKCKETYDNVKEKYENIRDTVSDKLKEVKEKSSDAWTKIKDKTSDIVSKMKDEAEDKYSKLKDKLIDTMDNWRKNSEEKWNKIKEKTASLVDTLKKDAEDKYNKLKDKLTDTMDNWKKNSEEKWNNIKDKTSDLVSKLKDETEDKYNKFKDKLTDTMDNWRKNSEEKWTKIKEKTTELAEDLKSTVEDKYDKFKEKLSTTLENLRKTSEDKWNDIKEKANAAVENLKTNAEDKFNTLKTNLASKMSDIKSDMETKWNSARDAISKAVETMRTNAENSFNTLKTNIGNKIEEVKTNVVNKWGEIKTETVNKVNEVVKDATTKYGELKTNFSTKMDELKKSLEPKWENLKTAAKTGASKMLDGISSGLSNITKTITKPFNDAKSAVEKVIKGIGTTFKNANWSFPKIKLPHLSVSGSFSLNPPKVPKFSVEWYKRGGIIDGITPLGFTGSTLHMGGEAGKEMVVPLENTSFTTKIAKAMGQAVDNAMARRERVYRSYDKTIDKSVVVLKVNENEFNIAGLNSVGILETSIADMWNNIKANSVESISDIVNSTGDMILALSNNLNSLNFDSPQEYVNNMADNMLNITQRMVVIMETMHVRTCNILEMLKYKFENLELTIPTPKIELPHFKISGGFSFNPPSVPEFSIEWYKRGGIINGITPLGMTGSTMHVGGEAGSEMVVPLENTSFTTKIAQAMGQAVDNAMARNMNSMYGSSYNTINDNRDIVLQINDREFARASINSINKLQRESGRTLLDI